MSTATIYEALRDRIRSEQPVALATVLEGLHVGAKLLLSPDQDPPRPCSAEQGGWDTLTW